MTHPFSPHRGLEYCVIDRIFSRGEERVMCCDSAGNYRSFLVSWTDYPTGEPAALLPAAPGVRFRDLQALARLMSEIEDV